MQNSLIAIQKAGGAMKTKTILLAFLICFSLLLVSCNNAEETVNAQDTAAVADSSSETIVEQTAEETKAAEETKTATNETTAAIPTIPGYKPIEPGIRPYAVMIDNEGTRSLPQGGLNMAQVIYEIIVEGGETRLMPVFWGVKPELIGPVRSSRHYFLDYVLENDAIYVHFGWSPQAQKDISKLKINNINGVGWGGEVFWDLTKEKGNWQDSYTSMDKLLDFIKKSKYRTTTSSEPVLSFNPSNMDQTAGEAAESINIRYSASYTCGYEYDANSGVYKRIRKGQPQIERVTGEQLTAVNIIIQMTENHRIPGDKYDRQEVRTVGSGTGYYITRGKAVKIKWSKKSRNSPTVYSSEDGKRIVLNPGPTWIQITPLSGKVSIK